MAETVRITTKKQALALLQQAVEVKGPDYVDPRSGDHGDGCKYALGNRPGCIVGHALRFAGVKQGVLKKLDDITSPGMGTSPSSSEVKNPHWSVNYLRTKGVEISEAARLVFAAAQRFQDKGSSWGTALRCARETSVRAGAVMLD